MSITIPRLNRDLKIKRPSESTNPESLTVENKYQTVKVDLWVQEDSSTVTFIEVKYILRCRDYISRDYDLEIKNKAGWYMGKFDFWHDVERLERILEKEHIYHKDLSCRAYAICLTNETTFWQGEGHKSRRKKLEWNRIVHNFETAETRKNVTGELHWDIKPTDLNSKGIPPGDVYQRNWYLKLTGTYHCDVIWHPYPIKLAPEIAEKIPNQEFRFSLIEAKPKLI